MKNCLLRVTVLLILFQLSVVSNAQVCSVANAIYVAPGATGTGTAASPTDLLNAFAIHKSDPARSQIYMAGGDYNFYATIFLPSNISIDGSYRNNAGTWVKDPLFVTNLNVNPNFKFANVVSNYYNDTVEVAHIIGMQLDSVKNSIVKDVDLFVWNASAPFLENHAGYSVYGVYAYKSSNITLLNMKISSNGAGNGGDGDDGRNGYSGYGMQAGGLEVDETKTKDQYNPVFKIRDGSDVKRAGGAGGRGGRVQQFVPCQGLNCLGNGCMPEKPAPAGVNGGGPGGGAGGACGDPCALDCYLQEYGNVLGAAQAGFNAVFDNSLPVAPAPSPVGHGGTSGANGKDGYSYEFAQKAQLYEMGRFYIPATGRDGEDGTGGSGGGGGGAGGIRTLKIPDGPGPAKIVTDAMKASLMLADAVSAAAGSNDVCNGQVLNQSTPGGPGGGGGEGGEGGKGGGGGGSVFGIYTFKSSGIAAGNITYDLGSAGTGGQGGVGGDGGTGYIGMPGPDLVYLAAVSNQGANGGHGGAGGKGGVGQDGGDGKALQTWGLNDPLVFAIDTAHICTNSIITVVKALNSTIYFGKTSDKSLSGIAPYTGTATVEVSTPSTGDFDIYQTSSTAWGHHYFKVTKTRAIPDFPLPATLCYSDTLLLATTDTTLEGYRWQIMEGGKVVKESSAKKWKFFPPVSGKNYTVNLQGYQSCCGWSVVNSKVFRSQAALSPVVSLFSGTVGPYCYGTDSTRIQVQVNGAAGDFPIGITWSNGMKDVDRIWAKDSAWYSATYTSHEGCVSPTIKKYYNKVFGLPKGTPPTTVLTNVCDRYGVTLYPTLVNGYSFNFYQTETSKTTLPGAKKVWDFTFKPFFGVGSSSIDSITVYSAYVNNANGCVGVSRGKTVLYHEKNAPYPSQDFVSDYYFPTTGACGRNAGYPTPTGTDDCSQYVVVNKLSGLAPGSFFPVGDSKIVHRLTDGFGNYRDVTTTIHIADNDPPTFSKFPNDTIMNTAPGTCNARYNFKSPTVTDNCTGTVTTYRYTSKGWYDGDSLFSALSGNNGITWITFQASDADKNTAYRDLHVTVKDNEAPVLNCPPNQVHYVTGNAKTFFTGYNIPLITDNCTSGPMKANFVSGFGQFGAHPVGISTEKFSFTDASLNTGTCSFTISVLDTIKPKITCPDPVYFKSDVGKSYTTITYGNPIAIDNVSSFVNITKLSGKASGDTASIGVHTAIWTAADSSGNVASCPVKITVSDEQAPNLVCPSNIFKVNDPGTCTAVVNYTVAPALDNDLSYYTPSIFAGQGLPSGAAFPMGTTNVVYKVADGSGNKAYCSFNVTVQDTVKPVFTSACPKDTTVNVVPLLCGVNLTLPSLTGTDNGCLSPFVDLMSGSVSGRYELGVTTQTYRLRDQSGNSRTCAYKVTVVDNNTLTVTCPSDIDLNSNPGLCTAHVTFKTPTVTPFYNSCISYGFSSGMTSGSDFPIGKTVETFTVTANGNSASCSFNITIHDTEKPHIVSPASIAVTVDPGNCSKVVNFTAPVGTDNCTNGLYTFLTTGHPSGYAFPIGTTLQTYVVGDLQGNTDTARFTITVRDTIKPVIPVHADVNATTDNICGMVVNFTPPVGTDNSSCIKVYKVGGLNSGDQFPLGTTKEIYVARDSAGNTDTCRFNIIVTPIYPLQSNCLTPWLQADPVGYGAVVYYPVPGVVDQYTGQLKCAGVQVLLESGLGNGAFFSPGPHPENYAFVVKGTGDTVRCSINVILTEFIPPYLDCGPIQTYTVAPDSGKCSTTLILPTPTFNDGPSGGEVKLSYVVDGVVDSSHVFTKGFHSVSYTARDYSNNVSTCNTYVNVIDDIQINNKFLGPHIYCEGEKVSVDAQLTGYAKGLTYNWIEENNFTTISTDSILTFDTLRLSDQKQYLLRIFDRCGASIQSGDFYLQVVPAPATTLTGLNTSYCIYDSADVALSFSPAGGTVVGHGVSGNKFNPKKAGVGTHAITYAYYDAGSGCTGRTTVQVNVYDAPKITAFMDSLYCINMTAIQLPAANSAYSGAGISGAVFNATTAGAGKHVITRTMSVNGCTSKLIQTVRVNAVMPNATISTATSICNASGNYSVTAATSGGTWSGIHLMIDSLTGIAKFNSRTAGIGKDTISYTVTKSGCTSTDTAVINIRDRSSNLPYTFPQFCTTGAPVAFDTTNNKKYVGSGFTKNIFTPSAVGARGPMFYYVVTTNSYGCVDTNYRLLNIRGGQLNVYADQRICTASDSVYIDLRTEYDSIKWWNGSKSNTIWLKGAGDYIVHLTDTMGCSGIDTLHVNYFAPPTQVALSNSVYACPGDSVIIKADSIFANYLWSNGKTTPSIKVLPGNYSVTVTTFDGCSYSSGAVNVYTAADVVLPTITCPADTMVYAGGGSCAVSGLNIGTAIALDNCGIASLTNDAPVSAKYFVGVTNVSWTAKDKANNLKTCLQKITVKDSIKPYFQTIPIGPLVVDTAQNNCSSKIPDFVGMLVAADSCSAVTLTQSPVAGSFATTEITPVVITAKDQSGNTFSHTLYYQALDTLQPIVNCPADVNVNTTGSSAVVVYAAPTQAANCTNSTVQRIAGLGSGAAFPVGTTIEKYVVRDGAGATDTCSFKVTVSVAIGITVLTAGENGLTVSPVPATDLLNIVYKNNAATTVHVKLRNAVGQLILDEEVMQFNGLYNKTVNLTEQSVGIYSIEIISDKGIVARKIVKM